MRTQLEAAREAVARAIRGRIFEDRSRLNQLAAKLEALSPVSILERGYALVFDANGDLIKDASHLSVGERISARLAKGTIAAEVKEIAESVDPSRPGKIG